MSRQVRNRLVEELKTDADFNAFCIDEFPEIHQGFSAAADRQQRINALFQLAGAEEVSRRLAAWLAHPKPLRQPPKRSALIWAALAALFLALFALSFALVLALLRPPQMIVVPIGQFDQHLEALGLTRARLDTPEQFAEKARSAGARNIRYEVSVDRDRETQELWRLVLALRVQNDQLVAATKYLLGQVKHWQHGTTHDQQFLAKLTQGFEERLAQQPIADMTAPFVLDMAPESPNAGHSIVEDLAAPRVDLAAASSQPQPTILAPIWQLPKSSDADFDKKVTILLHSAQFCAQDQAYRVVTKTNANYKKMGLEQFADPSPYRQAALEAQRTLKDAKLAALPCATPAVKKLIYCLPSVEEISLGDVGTPYGGPWCDEAPFAAAVRLESQHPPMKTHR